MGSYILYSLIAVLLCGSVLLSAASATHSSKSGGGLWPTNTYKLTPSLQNRGGRSTNCMGILAFLNSPAMNPALMPGAAERLRPNCTDPLETLTRRSFVTPAFTKIFCTSREYDQASGSGPSYPIIRSISGAIWRIAVATCSSCSSEMCRHEVSRSISATRPRASAASFSNRAARSFASAIIPSPASLARFSKTNSPQTPMRISAVEAIVKAPSSLSLLRINTEAISTANPTRISRASHSASHEFSSYLDRKLPLFAIAGYIRRRGRSAPTVWMAGICAIDSVLALVYWLGTAVIG